MQPPPAGTSPKELLQKYLDEHIHGVPAVSLHHLVVDLC